jgi:hypothetical protein
MSPATQASGQPLGDLQGGQHLRREAEGKNGLRAVTVVAFHGCFLIV